jgi:hypothetical protein
MLMDCPTIWAKAKIARIIQARWNPLGTRVVAGVGVVETSMVLVYFKEGLTGQLFDPASHYPFNLNVCSGK